MANIRAITAACQAVVNLFEASYQAAPFDEQELEFKVYTPDNFQAPMALGASLFPFRIAIGGVNRNLPGRVVHSRQQLPQLPLEAHVLLTIWAKDPSMQNTLVAWLMRCLEDNRVLPATLLNAAIPDCYEPDESVEIIYSELPTQEMMMLWDRLGRRQYTLSVPYIIRPIFVESTVTFPVQGVGQKRQTTGGGALRGRQA